MAAMLCDIIQIRSPPLASAAALTNTRLLVPVTASDRTVASRRIASDHSSSGMSSGRPGLLDFTVATIHPPSVLSHYPFARS